MRKAWWLPIAVLVLLSFDVWSWRRHTPMLWFWFMPAWMWHVAVVTALFSLAFAVVARYGWREA